MALDEALLRDNLKRKIAYWRRRMVRAWDAGDDARAWYYEGHIAALQNLRASLRLYREPPARPPFRGNT